MGARGIIMKSIRTKITLCLILTVLAGLVASGSSSIALNYNSTMSTVEQMMSETAVLAAGRAQQELAAYKKRCYRGRMHSAVV